MTNDNLLIWVLLAVLIAAAGIILGAVLWSRRSKGGGAARSPAPAAPPAAPVREPASGIRLGGGLSAAAKPETSPAAASPASPVRISKPAAVPVRPASPAPSAPLKSIYRWSAGREALVTCRYCGVENEAGRSVCTVCLRTLR